MIYSMTGFGRGAASTSNKKITVEIKSLNSKQLDLSMRVPDISANLKSRCAILFSAVLNAAK